MDGEAPQPRGNAADKAQIVGAHLACAIYRRCRSASRMRDGSAPRIGVASSRFTPLCGDASYMWESRENVGADLDRRSDEQGHA